MNKALHILLMMLVLGISPLNAAKPGSTGLNFLKIGVGAKAAATGGAFSAVADDGTAPYWNPAGLAQQHCQNISLMHVSWLESVNYQFLSYIHPTRRAGTFAASIYYLSAGDIQSYDSAGGRREARVTASDLACAVSYGRRIAGIDAGISAKIIRETLADESVTALAADAGLLYRIRIRNSPPGWIGQECRIALSAQNMGPRVTFIRRSDPLPLNYRFGVAQDFFNDSLTASFDVNFPSDDDLYVASGIDYRITDWVALRAGYLFRSNKPEYDIQPGLMGGLGLGNENISIDYAFVPYSAFGATHRIGLNCRFGRVNNERMQETKIQKNLARARAAYRKQELLNAFRAYNDVLMTDPVNPEALQRVSELQARINTLKADKYLQLVRTYLEQDEVEKAKELLDTILQLYPDNAEAKDYLARVAIVFEQQRAARAEALFSQGLEFYKQKQYADALTLWEKVLIVNPAHAQTKTYIPLVKEELAKIEEQNRREEEKALRLKADALFRQGLKFSQGRQWDKARQAFEEAQRLAPQLKEVDRHLSETNMHLAEEYYAKGQKYYHDKKLSEAVKLLNEAARLNPKSTEIADLSAKASGELKEMNTSQAEEYNRQGLKEYGLGNLKQAVESWEKAAALDPDNVKIKNNLNRAKDELNKTK